MAITITVENGTNVAGANSWQTVEQVREYASNRGIDLGASPATDDAVAGWLIRSADWLNGKRSEYKGIKTFPTGTMQWPRGGVYIDGELLDANTIPIELIQAQGQLVIALKAGIPLDSPIIGGVLPIIREKVDVLETEYASPAMMGAMLGSDWNNDSMPAVDALLAPLLDVVSGFLVYRV